MSHCILWRKHIGCLTLVALLLLDSANVFAQNLERNFLAMSDTAATRKIQEIRSKIKEIDNQLLNYSAAHTQAGLTLEMHERLLWRDDSIRTTLMSKRTGLLLEEKEVRAQSLRRVATNVSQVRTPPSATQVQQPNSSISQMQRLYRQNQRRSQRRR